MKRPRIQELEDLTTRLKAAHPTDACLAVLTRLLGELGRVRQLRREALALRVSIIAANLAAGLRWLVGVEGEAGEQVMGGWLAILSLSALAFLRVAWIRSRLRSLAEKVDELVALLRWLYQ